MNIRATSERPRKLFACLLFVTLALGPIAPVLAQETATLKGFIAFENRPAEGWKAVFVDSDGNEFVSGPADANGEYAVQVPPGPVYSLVGGKNAAGERFEVENPTATPVRVPTTINLSLVNFSEVAAAPAAAGGTAAAAGAAAASTPAAASSTSASTSTSKSKSGGMSKKKKGTIIGVVVGVVVAAALIAGGGSDDSSPSQP